VLASRVCIMSHGKVISLDSPLGIKRKYGVGYNLIIEANSEHGAFSSYQRAMYDAYVIKDSFIEGCSFHQDGSNTHKLVYMVPFDNDLKFSSLLRQLESFPNVIVAVEVTSLEDAYLRIVRAESKVKDDEEI
jgi:ABC-type multidrug transport system ATPase subunit